MPIMAEEFEAGWIGGLVQVAIGHPLDTIKTFGMFKGMLSPLASITTINSIVFGVRGNLLKYFDSPTLMSHFLVGSVAGAAQLVVSCPSELAKVRMQMSGAGEKTEIRTYRGSARTLAAIYTSEGLRGCYRGLVVTAMRDIPAFGFYFSTYEASRTELLKRNFPDLATEAVAGGIGGVCSWVFTYAVDSIKSRVQADGVGGVERYQGLLDAVYQSWKNESIFDLHKGMGVATIRAFVVNAFIFPAVYLSREYLVEKKDTF